ncbi:hypothetical protein N7493_001285 [Penicillium malachiteum]|uniref:Rhodopsin domain-containing protein n=1 Tax=Penicillium malachiteum TaxID=1324776 RepID=A0AAD6HTY1_9EURO|nr:hypothetical protein N7493_001285 [Penicillium malachiteum]
MTSDPAIKALFGSPASDVDLDATSVGKNNRGVIAMICLAAVAVVTRFLCRIIFRTSILADDYTIIVALLCISATAGISIAGGNYGAGHHVWSISLSTLEETYYSQIGMRAVALCPCRTLNNHGLFVYTSEVLLASIQRDGQWKLLDVAKFFIGAGVINMLNDFILLLIPFPRIIKLQMPVKKKAAICCIMAVGSFACVASIVRIYVLWQYTVSVDVAYHMGPLFIWSTIEPGVAIITACLPHLAPLFKLATQKMTSYNSEHTGAEASGDVQRLGIGTGRPRKFGTRGPNFHFGLTSLGTQAHDDKIGLTTYIGAPSNREKNPSIASESHEDNHDHHTISVKSTFVQTSTIGSSS